MKALFEFEFDPKTFIDAETLKSDFHNNWNEYMKWQYEQEGFGIFTSDATFVKVITDEENNMPTNDDTPTIDKIFDDLESAVMVYQHLLDKGEKSDSYLNHHHDRAVAAIQNLIDSARLDGMQQAKSRVLRRTEIPKDARNPTRDAVVILGENIADIINQDIKALEAKIKEGE